MSKTNNLMLILSLAFFGFSKDLTQEKKEIKSIVQSFVKAGDSQNSQTLEELLLPEYQIVMNQLFGSPTLSLMNKKAYLENIRSGKFGGDQRKIEFHQITVQGNSAFVQTTLKGKKMSFQSFLHLIKTKEQKWKLLSDTPFVLVQ